MRRLLLALAIMSAPLAPRAEPNQASVIMESAVIAGKTLAGHISGAFKSEKSPVEIPLVREVKLDRPRESAEWPSAAGPLDNNPGNMVARDTFRRLFSIDIGSVGERNLSPYPPVVAGDAIYAIDGDFKVSKYRLRDGKRLWRTRELRGGASGIAHGSIAFFDGAIFAATSEGNAARFDAETGKTVWRAKFGSNLKGAVKVCGGKMFVKDGANRLVALSASDGAIAGSAFFLDSPVGMIRGGAPACEGDTIVIGLQNGEVAARSIKSGEGLWSARAFSGSASSNNTIADVVASPVIFGGRVLVKTYGGGMKLLDLKSGREIWRADVSGRATPVVSGGVIFDADDNNMLRAIDAKDGSEIWRRRIALARDDGYPKSVLILNSRVWAFMSGGRAFAFDPASGDKLSELDLYLAITAPVASVGGAIFVKSADVVEVWQ